MGLKNHGKGRLILVRHGESEGNRERRFTLTPEVGLTELGFEQADATGAFLARTFRVERIIASPFRRTQQTAERIAAQLGLPFLTEPDIRERDFGSLAGQPYESVFRDPAFASGPRWEWRPDGGETLVEVQRRAAPAVRRIAAEHPTRDVVVVSHGGVMMALSAHFAGTWDGISVAPNCGILVVTHDGARFGAPEQVEP